MRIFSKIFSIIFVIVTILSLSLSIILAVSSSNISTFTNNADSRRNVFYTAHNKLSNSSAITITSKGPYATGTTGQTSEDKITCTINKENTNPEYNCTMISKLYNSDSSLVRTSYFPGDGYQYTVEGENKTKAAYPNTSLATYFNALLGGAQSYMSYLIVDNSVMKSYSMSYDTSITFNFSKFTLSKRIDINYTVSNEKLKIELGFDNHDYINRVVDAKTGSTLNISYSKSNIDFPLFVGFNLI